MGIQKIQVDLINRLTESTQDISNHTNESELTNVKRNNYFPVNPC